MPRDALICRTNSGISRIRMTITRPTIDSAQVTPEPDPRPTGVSNEWNWTMIQATATISGHRSVSNTHRVELLARSTCSGPWSCRGPCRGDVVDAAGGPRVAPTEPPHREPGAAQRTVPPDGDHGVLRTARVVPAGRRRQGRDDALVDPEQAQQEQARQPDDDRAPRPTARATSGTVTFRRQDRRDGRSRHTRRRRHRTALRDRDRCDGRARAEVKSELRPL